jgi:hypothetical protein
MIVNPLQASYIKWTRGKLKVVFGMTFFFNQHLI